MATAEPLHPHDTDPRSGRRRPFSTWVKKLTNFKNSSEGSGAASRPSASSKRHHIRHSAKSKPRRQSTKLPPASNGNGGNNPYPSSRPGPPVQEPSIYSFSTSRCETESVDEQSLASGEGNAPPTTGARSMAPTVSTDHEATHSIMAPSAVASSVAGTSRTAGGGVESRRGGDSTFSSPAPSVRSLTTTLTTIHSAHPGNNFPTTPASAIPQHLAPNTYHSATANNLLTDNASILTLASSSKRRRRRSLDTDASVRGLWGGSRESLPLSVLSANVEPATPGVRGGLGAAGGAAERTSIYSATGVVPALQSERNSYYKGVGEGDRASVRSGLAGHGRAESVSGSIMASPLASPGKAE